MRHNTRSAEPLKAPRHSWTALKGWAAEGWEGWRGPGEGWKRRSNGPLPFSVPILPSNCWRAEGCFVPGNTLPLASASSKGQTLLPGSTSKELAVECSYCLARWLRVTDCKDNLHAAQFPLPSPSTSPSDSSHFAGMFQMKALTVVALHWIPAFVPVSIPVSTHPTG